MIPFLSIAFCSFFALSKDSSRVLHLLSKNGPDASIHPHFCLCLEKSHHFEETSPRKMTRGEPTQFHRLYLQNMMKGHSFMITFPDPLYSCLGISFWTPYVKMRRRFWQRNRVKIDKENERRRIFSYDHDYDGESCHAWQLFCSKKTPWRVGENCSCDNDPKDLYLVLSIDKEYRKCNLLCHLRLFPQIVRRCFTRYNDKWLCVSIEVFNDYPLIQTLIRTGAMDLRNYWMQTPSSLQTMITFSLPRSTVSPLDKG